MRAPEFWETGGALAAVLSPLGRVYGWAGRIRRSLTRPQRAPVPVVCVGNLVAGGAGKTPVALALAGWLRRKRLRPHFLTRGYGGRARGPLQVDLGSHDVREVGDEALLLAAEAPTWVARDRPAGARAAAAAGAELIVMDDGHQNPSLFKDLSLVVVDGDFGFGNGRLIPAGPLRERVAEGLSRADALVLIGEDAHGILESIGTGLPVLRARLVPDIADFAVTARDVVAFAGIGRPKKFFKTLQQIGCRLEACYAFADHHRYTPDEIMRICEEASARDAVPVTTAKDLVRLPPEARSMVRVIRVGLEWDDPRALESVLMPLVEGAGRDVRSDSLGAAASARR